MESVVPDLPQRVTEDAADSFPLRLTPEAPVKP